MDDSTITCEEIIESYDENADAKAKSSDTMKQSLMKIKQSGKQKIFMFSYIFINYYSIIDSC